MVMNMFSLPKMDRLQKVVFSLASLVMITSLVVMSGWIIKYYPLVQIMPDWAPMQFNTAFGFFLSALCIIFHVTKAPRSMRFIVAGLLFLLGALSLGQYILDANFGIDQLFYEHEIKTKTSHIGRMAPNTALAFTFSGLGFLLFFILKPRQRFHTCSLTISSLMVIGLGVVALSGYFQSIEAIYGWGDFTRMAFHTAACFTLTGISAVMISYHEMKDDLNPLFFPVLVFAGVLILNLSMYFGFDRTEHKIYYQTIQAEGVHLATEIKIKLVNLIKAQVRVAKRWQIRRGTPMNEFLDDVGYYLTHHAAFDQIYFTDKEHKVDIVAARSEDVNDPYMMKGKSLALHFDEDDLANLWKYRETGVVSSVTRLRNGSYGFYVLSPIFYENEFIGSVAASYDFIKTLDHIEQNSRNEWKSYEIQILNENEKIVEVWNDRDGGEVHPFDAKVDFKIYNQKFHLKLRPLEHSFQSIGGTFISEIFFLIGVVLSFLVSFIIYFARKANEQSEQVQSKIREIEKVEAQLRESNMELEQFAYVASHDLQEPLRKITSFSALLTKNLEGQLDEKSQKHFDFLVSAARRMQSLIKALLEFSRANKSELVLEEVSIKEVFDDVKETMSFRFEETKTVLDVPESLPNVKVSKTLFTQVIQNILSNAIKFMPEDRSPHIQIHFEGSGECYQFCIQDNGIGIDAEFVGKVFEIFQRLHSREAFEGTGIGLAICKRIIERHGGKIWIESEKGVGSKVYFTLPK
jgi:signal transduction histidine kinase